MNEALLKKRIAETPRMACTDAVKLVYQNAFGCGHLLTEDEACLKRLAAEMAATPVDGAMPAVTLIGDGLCRLHLAAPATRALSPQRLFSLMKLTEKNRPARAQSERAFRRSLAQLRQLAERGETPFTTEALAAYLADYEKLGCPLVSHSEGYRQAYHPAYRVVESDFGTLAPLLQAMDAALGEGDAPVTVALDGSCGAGKTTLGGLLGQLYQAPVIHVDDFFLPPALRTEARLAQKGGNVHYERFLEQVVPHLASGDGFSYQRFDCATGGWQPRYCPPSRLKIIEGSYALHPRFQAAYERLGVTTAFVTVNEDEQLRRLRARDPERFSRFVAQWIPLEKSYFEAYDIKRRAKIVLQSLSWEESP